MPQNTTPQTDTSVPMPPMIEISKLAVGTILMVDTEMYLYHLEVVNPRHSVVRLETGDSQIGDGRLARVDCIQEGKPLVFQWPDDTPASSLVTHVEVSGVNEQGPWSYEVF